uniref:Uncharacterized protein n=1 Tax=Oryza brachyantha TaxID=4533 RepID=J3L360_ORYBR
SPPEGSARVSREISPASLRRSFDPEAVKDSKRYFRLATLSSVELQHFRRAYVQSPGRKG